MSDDGELSVTELVEYCRTQAALLAGRVETIGAETDEVTELDRTDDVDVAFRRIVEFEADNDALAYFDDRLTILESVADSGE
jgi:hypothetical protein